MKGLAASGWHTAAIAMRLVVEVRPFAPHPLLGLGVDELRWLAPVRSFGIQHGVQRLFHRPTHHLAKMIADPRFIDLDHLTHRLLVTHRLLLQCMKKPSILEDRGRDAHF